MEGICLTSVRMKENEPVIESFPNDELHTFAFIKPGGKQSKFMLSFQNLQHDRVEGSCKWINVRNWWIEDESITGETDENYVYFSFLLFTPLLFSVKKTGERKKRKWIDSKKLHNFKKIVS